MLSVAEAKARILELSDPLPAEDVPLRQAAGRVLAKPIIAARTQPPFAASAMDGYAVRNHEAQPGMVLDVIGESAAGHGYNGALPKGKTIRIFTGAPVPKGADAILIQEDAIRDGHQIRVRDTRDTKTYIRPAGADFSAGEEYFPNHRLNPQDIALAAAMNHAELSVRKRPIVALIATGDELVHPGQTPNSDQIVSSNNYGLHAMLQAAGADPRLLPIALDTPQSLSSVFDLAGDSDLIVTLGGASVGDHDIVQSTASEKGLELDFYKIAMRPGKPLMAGKMGNVPMIGLPGNPVSAMVCGAVFLLPLINRMLGLPESEKPKTAQLTHDLKQNGPREHYMRAHVVDGAVTVFERQDSALLSVLSAANALVIRKPYAEAALTETKVNYIPLS